MEDILNDIEDILKEKYDFWDAVDDTISWFAIALFATSCVAFIKNYIYLILNL